MFHLSPNHRKCLKEEIHKDVLVTGDYEMSEAPGQTANLKVSFRAILEKQVPYSQRYLFNGIPDTNHNANPNTRYRCEFGTRFSRIAHNGT